MSLSFAVFHGIDPLMGQDARWDFELTGVHCTGHWEHWRYFYTTRLKDCTSASRPSLYNTTKAWFMLTISLYRRLIRESRILWG